jgi:hypothetical protein
MPAPAAATFSFLSWAREGIAAASGVADGVAVAAGRLKLPLRLRLNATDVADVPLQLYGPGDVVGIDAQEIVRLEPPALASDFEPNYVPFIEFDHPGFPWMFTPGTADAAGKLRPWLCLVVVPKATAALAMNASRPAPVLDCPWQELPDLAESWVWAHAQAMRSAAVPEVKDALARPERNLSRLLCLRRLEPGTAYYACLVPAFEVGRKAGLGETVKPEDEAALRPAWTSVPPPPAQTRIQLPVYYHWEFSTGAEGDFEALARRLQPRPLPPTVGVKALDVSTPQWGVGPFPREAAGASLEVEGALRSPQARGKPWADDVRVPFETALRAIVDSSAKPAAASGSVVGPPLYGQWYPKLESLPAQGNPPYWLSELNLDPRYRIAAGLGALVVRYQQEELAASAWDQLAAQPLDNERRKRMQFAEALGQSFADRQVIGAVPPAPQATELLRLAPVFRQPMYEPLRDFFADLLLPGLERVPPNGVALLETNRSFVEAYMVGLNHEMTRELLWRGFPVDRRATYFRQFWDVGGKVPPPTPQEREQYADITPIGEWPDGSHLGDHAAMPGAPAPMVLAIRGDLFQRYPHAIVYAVEAQWSSSASNAGRVAGTREVYPMFRVRRAPDITMLGFGLTKEQLRGSDAPPGSAGWFFVLQEQPTAPRFGLDAAAARAFGTVPASWSELSWAHLAPSAAALSQIAYVPVNGVLKDKKLGAATWGKNAAHMASILRQSPFRLAIHARNWL